MVQPFGVKKIWAVAYRRKSCEMLDGGGPLYMRLQPAFIEAYISTVHNSTYIAAVNLNWKCLVNSLWLFYNMKVNNGCTHALILLWTPSP